MRKIKDARKNSAVGAKIIIWMIHYYFHITINKVLHYINTIVDIWWADICCNNYFEWSIIFVIIILGDPLFFVIIILGDPVFSSNFFFNKRNLLYFFLGDPHKLDIFQFSILPLKISPFSLLFSPEKKASENNPPTHSLVIFLH